jgi:hypothetical protein
MKIKVFAVLICSSVLAACSSNKNTVSDTASNNTTTTTTSLPKTATGFAPDRDGSSFERAIVLTETTERAGIDAQNTQLNALYPGSKKVRQHFEDYKGKQHDVVNITTADGRETVVYFDVSSYFGKQ